MDDATQIIRIVIDSSKAREGADQAKAALQAIENQTSITKSALDKLDASVEGFANTLKGMAIAAAVAEITSLATEALKAAAGLEVLSQQLGVSIDFLQAAKASAANSGVEFDKLETGFMRFSRTVGMAAEGNKKAIDLFSGMGVKILDSAGHLRDTESIFTDFAKSITSMQDPSMKAVDAQAAMGRGGQRLLPIMADLAGGLDAATAKARAMGEEFSGDTIRSLHALEVQSMQTKLQLQVMFADIAADPLTKFIKETSADMKVLAADLKRIDEQLRDTGNMDWIYMSVAKATAAVQYGVAAMGQAFRELAAIIGESFALAMKGVIETVEKAVNAVSSSVNQFVNTRPWLSRALGSSPVGAIDLSGFIPNVTKYDPGGATGRITAAGQSAYNAYLDPIIAEQAQRDENKRLAAMQGDDAAARVGGLAGVSGPGVSNPAAKGGGGRGDSLAARLAKFEEDAKIALQGATDAAAAANLGADAVSRLAIHTKDLKEVTDAYVASNKGNKDLTDAQRVAIDAETASLDRKNEATRVQNSLAALILSTAGLNEQNAAAQLQLSLTGQTTEEIARQLAIKKMLYDEQQKGITGSTAEQAQALQNNIAAIDQQAKLKQAITETGKEQALWIAPFKTAIDSVQSSVEGFFETILKGGTVTWQTVADTFKAIFIKMLAELAVLAVIRPIISPIVESFFSPGAAQSMGFSGGSSGGIGGLLGIFGGGGAAGGGASAGGRGGGGLFGGMPSFGSGGGFGSMFGGGFSDFLNTTWTGVNAGIAPSMVGVPTLASEGGDFAAAGGGLSIANSLGGIAGIGSGIFQLASGGGSTGSMLGGGASIIGGGLSLAASAGLIGSAFGPIGMGIGLLGGLLGSLFGGSEAPALPPLSGASTRFDFNNGRYTVGGSTQNGGAGITGNGDAMAQQIQALYDLTGGSTVAGKVYGGAQWVNYRDKTGNGYLIDPQGNSTNLGNNSDAKAIADLVVASVFKATVLGGGLSGISDTLKTVEGLTKVQTAAGVQTDIKYADQYDLFTRGGIATQAETSFKSINQSLSGITEWAKQLGIDMGPIDAERARQETKIGTDFMKTISQGLLGITDPLQAQLNALHDARDAAVKEATYINANVTGAFADMAKVTAYYTAQETALRTQFYAGAVASLSAAIDAMTYGSLSNASPSTTLSGTKGAYLAALAQAQGGNQTAINNLAGLGTNYVTAARSFYGTSQGSTDVINQVREALAQIQAGLQSGAVGSGPNTAANDPQTNAVLQANADLRQMVADLAAQVSDLTNRLDTTNAQLQRVAVNGR